MIFTCCICGTSYNNEAAAVKCVNKCGRAMHKAGVFQTKSSEYKEGEVKVVYPSDNEEGDTLKEECLEILDNKVLDGSTMSNGSLNFFMEQMSKWDTLSHIQRNQLHDMIVMLEGNIND